MLHITCPHPKLDANVMPKRPFSRVIHDVRKCFSRLFLALFANVALVGGGNPALRFIEETNDELDGTTD